MRFMPKRAFFEPQALEYPLGQRIYNNLNDMGIPIIMTGSHNRVTGIPGSTPPRIRNRRCQWTKLSATLSSSQDRMLSLICDREQEY